MADVLPFRVTNYPADPSFNFLAILEQQGTKYQYFLQYIPSILAIGIVQLQNLPDEQLFPAFWQWRRTQMTPAPNQNLKLPGCIIRSPELDVRDAGPVVLK